jgi:branched-chain amino acid transport system substrate-binding protein
LSARGPRALAVAAVLLAGLVAVAGCGGSSDARTVELHIGTLMPLTGAQQPIGEAGRKSAGLAFDQIRAAMRADKLGQVVTLDQRDAKSTLAGAINAVRTLKEKDASCIVGPYDSNTAITLSNAALVHDEILAISPGATSDAISTIDNASLLARVALPSRVQGPGLAELIDAELKGAKGKVVNIAAIDSLWAKNLVKSFREAWTHKEGRIGVTVSFPSDQAEFTSQARTLTANKPDAWVFFEVPDTYTKLATALIVTKKWTPAKTFTAEGMALPDIAGNTPISNGMRGVASGAPDSGAAPRAFARLYAKARGARRQSFDAQTFDATILCYLAAVAAGSSSGPKMAKEIPALTSPPGRKYTWQQLPAAVDALIKGDDIDYDGASGPIDLNEAGDPGAAVYDVYEFKDSKLRTDSRQIAVPERAGGI